MIVLEGKVSHLFCRIMSFVTWQKFNVPAVQTKRKKNSKHKTMSIFAFCKACLFFFIYEYLRPVSIDASQYLCTAKRCNQKLEWQKKAKKNNSRNLFVICIPSSTSELNISIAPPCAIPFCTKLRPALNLGSRVTMGEASESEVLAIFEPRKKKVRLGSVGSC